jgi:hypothetical protein
MPPKCNKQGASAHPGTICYFLAFCNDVNQLLPRDYSNICPQLQLDACCHYRQMCTVCVVLLYYLHSIVALALESLYSESTFPCFIQEIFKSRMLFRAA